MLYNPRSTRKIIHIELLAGIARKMPNDGYSTVFIIFNKDRVKTMSVKIYNKLVRDKEIMPLRG